MIEIKKERAKIIGEDRWPLLETFIDKITDIAPSVGAIHSLELVAFKPSGLEVKHNFLIVNARSGPMIPLIRQVYDGIAAGDEVIEGNLGRLVIVENKQKFWEKVATYSEGCVTATLTTLWHRLDR